MSFFHGAKTSQIPTSVSTPVTAKSGIPIVFGTAPIHTVGGKTNEVILTYTYDEAVKSLGYSDDWDKYTLCEFIYSQYKLYKYSPVLFVNVLDLSTHKESIAATDIALSDKKIKLPFESIKSTVVVKSESGTGDAYVIGDDYELIYSDSNLILEILDNGAITSSETKLNIAYDAVKPDLVTKDDIIGEFNLTTNTSTGLELIDTAFPKYRIIPDLICCPGWSHYSDVAAIMAAKAASINNIFEAKALIDIDSSTVTAYSNAPAWKNTNNIVSKYQVICYPMVALGGKKYHLSTHVAGLMAKVDTENDGCPAESPSNKLLQIDSAVLSDGTEVFLDLPKANYLNENGITTVLNFINGYVLWGNTTACYPSNTDVKDYFTCVSRMFAWVSNSILLTFWSKVDDKFNRRYIDSIVDSINIWLNGLKGDGKILGGNVEFREEDNPQTSLMFGTAIFHIYLTPSSPAQELHFKLEYNPDLVYESLFAQ